MIYIIQLICLNRGGEYLEHQQDRGNQIRALPAFSTILDF